MDKYAVETKEQKGKTAVDKKVCPVCGTTLDAPNHCPKCGTEPFEKTNAT